MALQPTIALYKNVKNPTIVKQPYVSFKILKKLVAMTQPIRNQIETVGDIDDSNIDTICEMVVVLFGGQVTAEELEEYADIDDIFECFLEVGRLSGKYSQKQQNIQNHPAVTKRRKNKKNK